MHTTLQKLTLVKNKVNEIISEKQLKTNPKIIIVTKTFALDKISPLIDSGHIHFGENKIQEAENKWDKIKIQFKNLKYYLELDSIGGKHIRPITLSDNFFVQ